MQEACKSSSKRQSHSVLPQRGNINRVCISNVVLLWSSCSHECMMDMYLFSWYQSKILHLMNTSSWCCYSAIVAALHANSWGFFMKDLSFSPQYENALPGTRNVKMSNDSRMNPGEEKHKNTACTFLQVIWQLSPFAFTALIDLQASKAWDALQWSHSLA